MKVLKFCSIGALSYYREQKDDGEVTLSRVEGDTKV